MLQIGVVEPRFLSFVFRINTPAFFYQRQKNIRKDRRIFGIRQFIVFVKIICRVEIVIFKLTIFLVQRDKLFIDFPVSALYFRAFAFQKVGKSLKHRLVARKSRF